MYLIDINSKSFIEGSPEFLTIKAGNKLNITKFLQDVIPNNAPHWKVENNQVVSKTEEEIQRVLDLAEYNNTKTYLFKGKRYRLEIEAAKLYATAAWPSLAIKALASDTIKTKVEYRDVNGSLTEFNIIFMDDILPNDKAFILSTEGFVLYDVEEINPDNPNF